MEIHQSNEYERFKFIIGNRSIDESKVQSYVEMIENGYPQDECPILVTKDLEILDGQHRFLAAKKKKTPVFYIISRKDSSSNAMIDINKNNNNWGLKDYVLCYAKRGNENYQKLEEFCNSNKISYGIALICFNYKRREIKDIIINENFKFDLDLKIFSERWLKKYREFLARLVISGEKDLMKTAASFSFLEAVMVAKNKKDDFFDVIFSMKSVFKHCSGFKGYLLQFVSYQVADE